MKIYTRTGDTGKTGLAGGSRIAKDSLPIETVGTIDELNALIGIVRSFPLTNVIQGQLRQIQSRLFDSGAVVASKEGFDCGVTVDAKQAVWLEECIDGHNQNLKELKQFCEHHIKAYVKEVISPKEELDFYITQSWLNVTKPGQQHHQHCHPNSIISGVFYVSTEVDDSITFVDQNWTLKEMIKPEIKEFTIWNCPLWFFPVTAGELVLFPSWLQHKVQPNEKATTDRISIAFNTFVRGKLGNQKDLTELIIT